MRILITSILGLLLIGCAGNIPANLPSVTNDLGSSQPYKLMAGDEIELVVTQRPDLSGLYTLDPDGTVYFPVGGPVKLEDLTQTEAEEAVVSVLRKFYSPLTLILKVRSFQSSQFFTILGEVNSPGIYPIENKLSFIKAIGLAEGFTQQADISKIDLVRNAGNGSVITINFGKVLKNGNYDIDYIIQKDDMVFVHRKKYFGLMDVVNPVLPLTQLGILTYLTIYQIRLTQVK